MTMLLQNINFQTGLDEKLNTTEVVLVNGSSVLKGHLLMDSNRIQDIGNPRQNEQDAMPYLYFSTWYMQFEDENVKLNVKNLIDMGNKKITNLADPLHHKDSVNKFYVDSLMVSKADKTELGNCILKSGLTADLDMKHHRIVNLKTPENSTDAVNWSFLSQELSNT